MVLDNLAKMKAEYGTDYVRVTMTNTTTIETFIGDVAQQLHLTRNVQTINTNQNGQGAQVGVGVRWFKANLASQGNTTAQQTVEQYTGSDDFAILAEALFKRNTVLVVDDMENLSMKGETLRIRLAEIAKNMSDNAVEYDDSYAKIVFVGIADTAEQLWSDVQSLKSRLATISVPYLNVAESEQIIKTGWSEADLISTDDQVEKTAYISNGIGKVVHELGQKTGYATVDNDNQVIDDRDINQAVGEILDVNTLGYKDELDRAKNKTATKTTVKNYVLYVIANDDRNEMTSQEILTAVNRLRHDETKGLNSISPSLTALKKQRILVSPNRNSWGFRDPMFKAYVREHENELLLKEK